MTNSVKTVLLLGLLTGVLLYGGELLAGRSGLYLGLAFAVVMNSSSYFFSDKISLAAHSAVRVEGVDPDVARRVKSIAQDACSSLNLPTPTLYLISGDAPPVLVLGRNPLNASLAFAGGALCFLSDSELKAIAAAAMKGRFCGGTQGDFAAAAALQKLRAYQRSGAEPCWYCGRRASDRSCWYRAPLASEVGRGRTYKREYVAFRERFVSVPRCGRCLRVHVIGHWTKIALVGAGLLVFVSLAGIYYSAGFGFFALILSGWVLTALLGRAVAAILALAAGSRSLESARSAPGVQAEQVGGWKYGRPSLTFTAAIIGNPPR